MKFIKCATTTLKYLPAERTNKVLGVSPITTYQRVIFGGSLTAHSLMRRRVFNQIAGQATPS